MKLNIDALLVTGLVIVSVVSVWKANSGSPDTPIVIDPIEYQFGDVKPGTMLNAEFHIRNASANDLTIHNGIVSCSCTRAHFDKHVLASGESTTLGIDFEIGTGMRGTTSSPVVVIWSLAGSHKKYRSKITVNANVDSNYAVIPEGDITFQKDEAATREIVFTSNDKSFAVIDAYCSHPAISCSIDKSRVLARDRSASNSSASSWVVTVRHDPAVFIDGTAKLTVVTTDRLQKQYEVRVRAFSRKS